MRELPYLPFHEGEAGATAKRVVALPAEGATRAEDRCERSEIEGEAPVALPAEGATRAPVMRRPE
jgi:hypothetical protein